MSLYYKVMIIQNDLDIVTTRLMARDMAKGVGFSAIEQARIATAASELTRRIFRFTRSGEVAAREIEKDGRRGIEIEFRSRGSRISDIQQALQHGRSARRGNGNGNGNGREKTDMPHWMSEFEIRSIVGFGAAIVCREWCSSNGNGIEYPAYSAPSQSL
jgi:serine/threonine-protein kinase RsbT